MEKFKDQFLSYADLEVILGVPRSTLYGLVHRGVIPHTRLTKRLVLFREEEIADWIQRSSKPGGVVKQECEGGV